MGEIQAAKKISLQEAHYTKGSYNDLFQQKGQSDGVSLGQERGIKHFLLVF